MKQRISLILLSAAMVYSCERESPERSRDYPILYTLETDVDTNGATLHAKVANLGDAGIREFGFVWGTEPAPTINGYKIELPGDPVIGPYSYKITSDLEKDVTYYARAYIKSSEYLVYGNQKSFESQGSSPPEILSFSPSEGPDETEITITGRNFSVVEGRNLVTLADAPCMVMDADTGELVVQSPEVSITGDYPISVTVLGQTAVSEERFGIRGPQITSVVPAEGKPGDLITLEGEYLTIKNFPCNVYFGSYNATVYSAKENKLEVLVPAMAKDNITDKKVKISITSGAKNFAYPDDFTVKQSWWNATYPPAALSDWEVSCSFSIGQYGYVLDAGSLFQYNEENDSWVQKAAFPGVYRGIPFVFVMHGKAYMGAGIGNDPYYKTDMWEYDPVDDSWKQLKDLPACFYTCTGFAINDYGYVVVGIYSNVWQYDPEEDSWTALGACPAFTNTGMTSFVIDAKAYITNYDGELWEYDGMNDTWSQKSNCPWPDLFPVFSVNRKGYACRYESEIYAYDPDTDTWTRIQDYPGYSSEFSFVIGGKGFIGSLRNGGQGYFYYFVP